MAIKLLLVEDNEMNRDMLSRRLLKRGYEIVIAEDGAKGVELAKSEAPDLILMDLSLPIMDGWAATRTLKANAATRQIPVIALTAHAMSGDREKALEAGCDDYDTKPVDISRLVPKIEALLSGSAARPISAPKESAPKDKSSRATPAKEPAAKEPAAKEPAAKESAAKESAKGPPPQVEPDKPHRSSASPSRSTTGPKRAAAKAGPLPPNLQSADVAASSTRRSTRFTRSRVKSSPIDLSDLPSAPSDPKDSPNANAEIADQASEAPVADRATVANETQEPAATMAVRSQTTMQPSLLVVDDNEMNRDMLSRRLIKEGYEVTLATDGQEALTLIEDNAYDLVLLDVMMPGISGLEVLSQLRQHYSQSQLPIIMVTAKDQSEDVVGALDMGANDYITKPIDFPIALARVRSQLSILAGSREHTSQVAAQAAAATPPHDPALLKGRYRLMEILGSGGFGRTFLAQDIQRPGHPTVVVKHLKPTQTTPKWLELARRLFTKEAETLERLKNDQIPRLLAYFEENQEFYLVQEFIDGVELSQEFEHKRFTDIQVLGLLWDLMKVLHYIHQNKVIHRDIKPQNIIRRHENRKLVLIDFGAVKELSMELGEGPKETVGIGSRGFAPPEQYAGRPRYNSDIYAVGMVAIQALTGLLPEQLVEDVETGEMLWQGKHIQIDPRLAAVINKMIRANFAERYQSAAEVARDLKRIIEDIQRARAKAVGKG